MKLKIQLCILSSIEINDGDAKTLIQIDRSYFR
jgi:hypothetical protein